MTFPQIILLFLAIVLFSGNVSCQRDLDKYEEMIVLDGGRYWKGDDDKQSRDGTFPPTQTSVKKFKINKYPVTNYSFRKFVKDQRYLTTAEEYTWSFVFESDVPEKIKSEITDKLPNAEWWVPVPKAYWKHPEGEGSNINTRLNWPAVHISHIDATAYCKWKGLRLPTEDEWEFAVRGTLDKKKYPWGNKYEKNRMNIWQGKFPEENQASDGYTTVAPVDAYPPQNDYVIYDMLGNTWEWTSTPYKDGDKQESKTKQYTLRGGSFIDSKDGSSNHKARNAVRMGNGLMLAPTTSGSDVLVMSRVIALKSKNSDVSASSFVILLVIYLYFYIGYWPYLPFCRQID